MMGKTWMVLKAEETVRVKKVFYDPYDKNSETYKYKGYESCILCHTSECNLYGYYGTYNEFGSFRGICSECLERLNKLSKEV